MTRVAADQHLERQRLGAGAVVEEMARRVDVGAGVRAHVQRRDVGAVAAARCA